MEPKPLDDTFQLIIREIVLIIDGLELFLEMFNRASDKRLALGGGNGVDVNWSSFIHYGTIIPYLAQK